MELRKFKSAQKKPAMALVLIIIILTSLTFVIMGTIKLVTASSGKFSINKNATGVFTTKKVKGRYICFKYNNKLYQTTVKYNSDGSVNKNNTNYAKTDRPLTEPCNFVVPEDANQLNVTLIGGGSYGIVQKIKNIRYLHDKSSDVGFDSDSRADNVFFNTSGGTVEFGEPFKSNGTVSIERSAMYGDTECKLENGKSTVSYIVNGGINPSSDIDLYEDINNLCCIKSDDDCSCKLPPDGTCSDGQLIYKPASVDPPADEVRLPLKIVVKILMKISDSLTETIFTSDMFDYDKASMANLYSILSSAKILKSPDTLSVRYVCGYQDYYFYESSSVPPPGSVHTFIIPKDHLKGLESNRLQIASSNIGNGGTSSTNSGGLTCFKYKYTDSKTNSLVENKQCTPKITTKNVNSERIKVGDDNKFDKFLPESGLEANYFLHKDFKLDKKNDFYLHAAYASRNSSGGFDVDNATLFGSSGALIPPSKPVCDKNGGFYGDLESNREKCDFDNGVESCNPPAADYGERLNGAPGAIIIEW